MYEVRKRIGAELAKDQPAPADIVIPVPDSGVPAAIGYAQAANLPFELGLIRNHYVGRTFIEPSDRIRHLGVKLKHNANHGTVAGGAWCWSTIRSCAAPPRPRSWRWSARPARPRCTCGSRARRPPIPASTASTRLSAASFWPRQRSRRHGANHRRRQPRVPLARRPLPRRRRRAHDPAQPQYCDACFSGDYRPRSRTWARGGGRPALLDARGRLT